MLLGSTYWYLFLHFHLRLSSAGQGINLHIFFLFMTFNFFRISSPVSVSFVAIFLFSSHFSVSSIIFLLGRPLPTCLRSPLFIYLFIIIYINLYYYLFISLFIHSTSVSYFIFTLKQWFKSSFPPNPPATSFHLRSRKNSQYLQCPSHRLRLRSPRRLRLLLVSYLESSSSLFFSFYLYLPRFCRHTGPAGLNAAPLHLSLGF